jgi:hypothetical protein
MLHGGTSRFRIPMRSLHVSFYLILPAGVYSALNGIEYQEYFWGETQQARMVDKLTAICEPIS